MAMTETYREVSGLGNQIIDSQDSDVKVEKSKVQTEQVEVLQGEICLIQDSLRGGEF